MTSITKSVNELERAEQSRQLCHDAYVSAIRAVSEYVVELNPARAAEFRRSLCVIQNHLEGARSVGDLHAVQSSFRGELRLYRDQAVEWLERTSRELQASAIAMQTLAGSLTANSAEQEAKLVAGLRSLASVQASDDLPLIKRTISAAASNIAESWEELRRVNQLVTLQLQDEIQSLHRQIDSERRALFTDAPSGAWNREKIKLRIEDNLGREDAFCLLMVSVTNLKRLSAIYSQPMINEALRALVKRVHGTAGRDAMISRWSPDRFAVLLELSPEHAIAASNEIARDLNAPFVVQDNGMSRRIALRISTAVAGRPLGSDPAQFREKLALLDSGGGRD